MFKGVGNGFCIGSSANEITEDMGQDQEFALLLIAELAAIQPDAAAHNFELCVVLNDEALNPIHCPCYWIKSSVVFQP